MAASPSLMVRKLVLVATLEVALAAGCASPVLAYFQTPKPFPPVEASMRRVDFHVDESIVLRIEYLRGRLLPERQDTPPVFDNKQSFSLAIDTAEISLDPRGLGELLNRYVFAYSGAPLKDLRITIEGKRLRQRGRVNGFPFNMLSDVRLSRQGELHLTPVSIKAFGLPVKGLMHLFGITLEKMIDLRKAHGIRAERNDLVLAPLLLLPPPAIRGRLTRFEVRDSVLLQVFRPEHGPVTELLPPDSIAATNTNYMYYRGGSLRFGRLTMMPADLLILDADPTDRFDFFLGRYKDQLVAGFSRNTMTGGLITTMPDYRKLGNRK